MENSSDLNGCLHTNGFGLVKGRYVGSMSLMTRAALAAVVDDIITQAKQVPFTKSEAFCIGDFGCADGATSTDVIQGLLTCLKDLHGNDTPVKLIYEDQPLNDFNALFLRHESNCAQLGRPWLENVFMFACGRSFYKQCVPSKSMHVILSFYAAHWLSRRPTTYQNSIWHLPNSAREEKDLLLKQAEADWEQFLLMRGKELKSGGRLFVVVPSDGVPDDKGAFKVHNSTFLKLVSSTWRSFTERGKISHQEFINTNMDTCHYNLRQIRNPFDNTHSQVYKSGLRLQSLKNISCFSPEYLEWKQRLEQEGVDDRKTYAEKFVNIRRCFTNNVFFSGLSDNRSKEEKEMLVNELFQQVEDVLSSWNPEDLKNEMNDAFICVYKL